MTKLLAQLLEAKEPQFHQTVKGLEVAHGLPCHDIRLSESINQGAREKISDLGLDANDTKPAELYYCLQEKLKSDDVLLIKRLRQVSAQNVSAEGNISDGIAYSLSKCAQGGKLFVIKATVVKKFLQKYPPKKTMKALGYRSLASMLKHEPLGPIVAAALIVEPASWQSRYTVELKRIKASDFEERGVSIVAVTSPKWHALCSALRARNRQTIIVNKELGTLIILSLPNNLPVPGLTSVTLGAGITGLNAIYSASSYLRLNQVTANFSERLLETISDEPTLTSQAFFNAPLSWETVQRFFHHMAGTLEDSLEAHIGTEELIGWQPMDDTIHRIAPELEFWKGSGHLAFLNSTHPVSFNFLDNALSLVNGKAFGEHYSHHQRRSLWQEFILRYIRPDILHDFVSFELNPQLETAVIGA